jgi:FkbM family methyltransferase
MKNRLIYDIGCHSGEDTQYYLSKGFRVVAVDAAPELIKDASVQFASYIQSGQLTLLHAAISDKNDDTINFYLSKTSVWNSAHRSMANRFQHLQKTIRVKTKTLASIIQMYGPAYYCKIDIEGNDKLALQSLRTLATKPVYISTEQEDFKVTTSASSHHLLDSLDALHKLGYRKFKLIDQMTLAELRPYRLFYTKEHAVTRLLKQSSWGWDIFYRYTKEPMRQKAYAKYAYTFPLGSSGAFGKDLDGQWLDYAGAAQTVIFHGHSATQNNVDFWCDWHAT